MGSRGRGKRKGKEFSIIISIVTGGRRGNGVSSSSRLFEKRGKFPLFPIRRKRKGRRRPFSTYRGGREELTTSTMKKGKKASTKNN